MELRDSLESVVEGHGLGGERFFFKNDKMVVKEVPERFNSRWSDLARIESGFIKLHMVLSDSDIMLSVKICTHITGSLFDRLRNLIRKSMIERYIIFEGKQACKNSRDQWVRIWRTYKAIDNIFKNCSSSWY